MSLPVRGAWVEISPLRWGLRDEASLPVRGAWVEIIRHGCRAVTIWSLPVRGAWVEISILPIRVDLSLVAPRAGSVG